MLLVCEKLEITIILYILYIRIILKGTELVVQEKNIKIVVEKINKEKAVPNRSCFLRCLKLIFSFF